MMLFIGDEYNIVTDKVERIIPDDPRILVEVYVTYCQIRKVRRAFRPSKLEAELIRLDKELLKRIEALEPIKSGSNDS